MRATCACTPARTIVTSGSNLAHGEREASTGATLSTSANSRAPAAQSSNCGKTQERRHVLALTDAHTHGTTLLAVTSGRSDGANDRWRQHRAGRWRPNVPRPVANIGFTDCAGTFFKLEQPSCKTRWTARSISKLVGRAVAIAACPAARFWSLDLRVLHARGDRL